MNDLTAILLAFQTYNRTAMLSCIFIMYKRKKKHCLQRFDLKWYNTAQLQVTHK